MKRPEGERDLEGRLAAFVDTWKGFQSAEQEGAQRFLDGLRVWETEGPWEVFGSIFERGLDPVQRHGLGAHFTREADIARVVGPTIIEPWRERIAAIRTQKDAERVVAEMQTFHVLDPACGCGNFLYVVYREMKRLEAALVTTWNNIQRKVQKRRADFRPAPPRPYFTLAQLHGLEKEPFAAFLARVVLWIGEHLAKVELALDDETLPLKNLDDNVKQADALFVPWPRPEGELAIVGNPPYLGVRKLRKELGDDYVEKLFAAYPNNRAADYVTYWFPKALETLRAGERAGFVCTNSIAQNESREASIDTVIAAGGTLTDAWKSYPWPSEAAVHVAIVNWVMAPYDGIKRLDSRATMSISPGLTESIDVSRARTIMLNRNLCFMGVTTGNNGFILTQEERDQLLAADPGSAAVIRPYLIGRDVNREVDQQPTRWIIDFASMSKEEAEAFPGAMRHVRGHVCPTRKLNKRETDFKTWWQFWRAAPNLRVAIEKARVVLAIPRVSPHLIVSRQPATTCFDGQIMVVALSSPYHFGLMQSRLHELWARERGSTLKGDLRYTNTTIFETFPFPPLTRGKYDPRLVPGSTATSRLEAAANAFEKLRSALCKEHELGLTKVHNLLEDGELPELGRAYDTMNDAVAACYGFPEGLWRDEREALRTLLELNDRLAPPATTRAPVAVEEDAE